MIDCVQSSWISSSGAYLDAFEAGFATFCGVRHAVACSSGTAALHLALTAIGIAPGDEVIIPDLTYVAVANAVRYCAAVPILADIDPVSMTIDPVAIERLITPATRAIEEAIAGRHVIAARYDRALQPFAASIALPSTRPWATHAFWMYTIQVTDGSAPSRDEVMARLDADGIETRPTFYPMHVLPPYLAPGDRLTNATRCGAQGINLPSHEHLSVADVDYVCASLARAIGM